MKARGLAVVEAAPRIEPTRGEFAGDAHPLRGIGEARETLRPPINARETPTTAKRRPVLLP